MANAKDAIAKPVKNIGGKIKRTAWSAVIESLILMLFGILLIACPYEVIYVIAKVFGIILIVVGAYQIINYFVSQGMKDVLDNSLLSGVIYALIGIAAIAIDPVQIANFFRIVVGILLIYEGLVRVNTAIKLHAISVPFWGYILVLSLAVLALGIVVLCINAGDWVQIVGGIMIAAGIISIIGDIMFIFKVDSVEKNLLKKIN